MAGIQPSNVIDHAFLKVTKRAIFKSLSNTNRCFDRVDFTLILLIKIVPFPATA